MLKITFLLTLLNKNATKKGNFSLFVKKPHCSLRLPWYFSFFCATHFYTCSQILTFFAQPNEILSRDKIRQKDAIKNTFLTDFALITKNFAKNRNRQIFTFNFTSSLCLFSQKKNFSLFLSPPKINMKNQKKKVNKKNKPTWRLHHRGVIYHRKN